MNWLAHLWLSRHDGEEMVGNLLGDFLRGPLPADMRPAWRRGALLHRAIDEATDAHDAFRRARRRLPDPLRHTRGPLLDLCFDHVLARGWERWHDRPLPEFTAGVYARLRAAGDVLPRRLATMLPRMAAEDWLAGYASEEGLARAVEGLRRRLRRPAPLGTGLSAFLAERSLYEADLAELLPALVEVAARRRAALGDVGEAPGP